MKKLLLLIMPLLVTTFNSCSKDGDGNKVKLLRTMYVLDEDNNRTDKMSFTYDSQNRLTMLESSPLNHLSTFTSRYTINYSTSSITIKTEWEDGSESGGNTQILNLTGGFVTSITTTYGSGSNSTDTYTYNNGYLTSVSSEWDTEIFTWENGNITRRKYNEYTYNTQLNSLDGSNVNLNFLTDIDVYEIDIFPINLRGVSSKNLVTRAGDEERGYTVYYEFNNDGTPTKANVREYNWGPLEIFMDLEYEYK